MVSNPYTIEELEEDITVTGSLEEEQYVYDGVYGPIPDENGFVNLDNYAETYILDYRSLSEIPKENQKYLDSGIKPTSMINAFGIKNSGNYSTLLKLDLSKLDTSFCTDMSYAFYYLLSLQELNISNWNTGNVANMKCMFDHVGGSSLVLDVSNFNTSKVTNMSCMFRYVSSPIDVSNFNTSKVTDMSYMFKSYKGELDVSNFNTSNVTNMGYMFDQYGANSKVLDVSNFNTSKVTSMTHMFYATTATIIDATFDLSNCVSVFFTFEGSSNIKGIHLKNVPRRLDFGDIGGTKGETYIIDNYID